jgi:hypothetical protein
MVWPTHSIKVCRRNVGHAQAPVDPGFVPAAFGDRGDASVLLQRGGVWEAFAAQQKLSVSMPRKLASAARKRAGRRGLSSFVARAVARELEREALGEFLDELDTTLGPLP